MKKMFAIVLALMLCVSVLSVAAFAAEGDTITVHAQVPADWEAVAAYTWEPEDLGAWPGSEMTLNGDWYEVEMPGTHTTLIINNNNNGAQTSDLTIEAGKDVWLVLSDAAGDDGKFTATVSYEAPSAGSEGGESTEGGNETTEPETTPTTGDMSIAAVSVALLAATAGLVAVVRKKKEN